MCQQPMHVFSLCPLNLILLLSSLSSQERGDVILLQELGQHVNLLLHAGAFRMIAFIAVCTLAHFSFVLLLLEFLLGARGILLIL